jgi:hypothetical protein
VSDKVHPSSRVGRPLNSGVRRLYMRSLMVLLAIVAARTVVAADVEVVAEVVDSGMASYEIRTTITNVTGHDLDFAVMKCGWDDSFRVEPEVLSISSWGCDGNYPTSLKLSPGAKAVFEFRVTAKYHDLLPKRLRVGFETEYSDQGLMFRDGKPWWPGRDPKAPVAWSVWLDLPPAARKGLDESHKGPVVAPREGDTVAKSPNNSLQADRDG